jgi:hypothetical protein
VGIWGWSIDIIEALGLTDKLPRNFVGAYIISQMTVELIAF